MRWVTPEQAPPLLAKLPEHQREMVLFALATGLRQGNVTGLCWSKVDLARRTAWVHGEDAKNGDDLHVSLNHLAMEVLWRQHGKHAEASSRTGAQGSPTSAGTTSVTHGRPG